MKYTKEQIEKAKNANLLDLLLKLNYPLKRVTAREYTLLEHDSLKISPDRGWYWHSRQTGGNAIDFFMQVEGKTFLQAMEMIIGNSGAYIRSGSEQTRKEEGTRELRLPVANWNNDRVIKYLTETRGLSKPLVLSCIKRKTIYQAEKTFNAVFVGYDDDGKPRYASQRGTSEKRFAGDITGSSKDYGFFFGKKSSKTLHIFEAPIDLLSYITLENLQGRQCHEAYLALGGVSTRAFERYLSEHEIDTVYVRTDSDEAGRLVYRKLQREHGGGKLIILPAFPTEKDYNEELLKYKEEKNGQK